MEKNIQENIIRHDFALSQKHRIDLLQQKPKLIWFTGLSGSGKSTLANSVELKLAEQKFHTYTLDGDNVRKGICNDLGFSDKDRSENIRRIAEVSNLMLDAGLIVCACFVSPFQKDRDLVRAIVGTENFIEIYVSTPLSECERRDVKGLYAKARKGEIVNFTGISSRYEVPENPNVTIDTTNTSIEKASQEIIHHIISKIK